jgi:hypothetical protein
MTYDGANGPRQPVAPAALEAGHFELEGHRIEIVGPMQGDHMHCTAVWIPDARTLVAGDLLFNQMHLWLGESLKPARLAWAETVEKLAAPRDPRASGQRRYRSPRLLRMGGRVQALLLPGPNIRTAVELQP